MCAGYLRLDRLLSDCPLPFERPDGCRRMVVGGLIANEPVVSEPVANGWLLTDWLWRIGGEPVWGESSCDWTG